MGKYGIVKLRERSLTFTRDSDICQAVSNLPDAARSPGHPKATQSQSSLTLATQGKRALVLTRAIISSKMDLKKKSDRDY